MTGFCPALVRQLTGYWSVAGHSVKQAACAASGICRNLDQQREQAAMTIEQQQQSFHVALTGHRPNKLAGYDLSTPFYVALQEWLEHIIKTGLAQHPHLTLHSGLALGADTVWSQAILAMRERFPGRIAFVAEVPLMTQSSRWPAARDKEYWQTQIDSADLVNVYAQSYSPQAMQLRNEGMIGAAQLVLALWDGSTGGTAHAVRFAEKNGIQVFRMTPEQIATRAAAHPVR
jgi:uncharacterized phage-like protein YoqJ